MNFKNLKKQYTKKISDNNLFSAIMFCHPINVYRLSHKKQKRHNAQVELMKDMIPPVNQISFRTRAEHINSSVMLNSLQSIAA